MKKHLQRLASIILCMACCIPCVGCANDEIKKPSFVTTSGTKLMRGDEEIVLRGVNAGGWLLQESWMCPTDMVDQRTMIATLTDRFGADKCEELLDIYEENWWTAADFVNVKNMGFNCIRLPFTYMNMLKADYSLRDDAFERLDWFVEQCAANDLLLILDMHGAVGSQNGRDHSGDTSRAELFLVPEYREATKNLWVSIAEHYRDNTTIAAYDLLNEPEGGLRQGLTSYIEWKYFDELYDAIRAVDDKHIIIMESVWEAKNLPAPTDYEWTNVIYEFHNYCWTEGNDYAANKAFIDKKVADYTEAQFGVPILIGEFTGFDNLDNWHYTLSQYNSNGYSWTIWTYKVVGLNSSWGLYTTERANVVNPQTDCYEDIAAKWSAHSTSNYSRNTSLCDVISSYATAPLVEASDK